MKAKFYIIDNEGTVHGESEDREWLELHMEDIFTPEEIKELEIEIIED